MDSNDTQSWPAVSAQVERIERSERRLAKSAERDWIDTVRTEALKPKEEAAVLSYYEYPRSSFAREIVVERRGFMRRYVVMPLATKKHEKFEVGPFWFRYRAKQFIREIP